MSRAATSQLYTFAIIAVVLVFGIVRRMRPQPVRPNRLMVSGAIIVVLLGVSLVATGAGILGDPLALILIPVFLVAGGLIGFYLVRTMQFWTDQSTGALWMKGGALFAVILIGTILLRFGVRTAVYGSPFAAPTGPSASHGFLYDLSADLLFLSLGLWVSRAYFLYLRHRAHLTAPAAPR
jgi:hypothetical protein